MPSKRAKHGTGVEQSATDSLPDAEAKLNALVEELEVEGTLHIFSQLRALNLSLLSGSKMQAFAERC